MLYIIHNNTITKNRKEYNEMQILKEIEEPGDVVVGKFVCENIDYTALIEHLEINEEVYWEDLKEALFDYYCEAYLIDNYENSKYVEAYNLKRFEDKATGDILVSLG